jgi:hypothetical protein
MHEVFEHTADLGLRIAAPSLDLLLAEAGVGLFALAAGPVLDGVGFPGVLWLAAGCQAASYAVLWLGLPEPPGARA